MNNLNKKFIKGDVLTAREMNELVDKINELSDAQLVIGDTEGAAYDGAKGAVLEQTVRELAGSSGTMYSVYVRNNMESLGFASQYGESCILDFSFISQYRNDWSEAYKPTGEPGLCTIMVKNAKYTDFTIVKQLSVSSNTSIKQDVSEWLSNGSNSVKITVAGENTDKVTSPVTYTVQLTSMGISAPNFQWWTAFTSAVTIPLNIGGNISKTLHVTVSGEEYNQSYDLHLGTTIYTETAYNYQMEHPGKSGVYHVSMYVSNTDGTIRTRAISYNIICVLAGDDVKLMAINNVLNQATNWAENALFDYTIYDGSNVLTSAQFIVSSDGEPIYTSNENSISTSAKQTFSVPLEVETVDSADFNMVVHVKDGDKELTSALTIPVNNSLGFSSVAGAAFYMNPRTRSNNQSNSLSVVNEMNGELLPATWKGMNWGNDGWTTDSNSSRVLRLMAGSSVDIRYRPFEKESARTGKTIEIDYKVDNVTDFNYPVIRISGEGDSFVGLRIFPDHVLMFSNAQKNTDNQSINLFEGKRLRLTLVIMPDAYGNSGFNLCIIYINGVKNREFTYENNDYFAQNSNISMGSEYADIDVYGIRTYDSALTSEAVLRNYINWQSDNSEKIRIQKENDVMDGNGSEISFENTVDQYNVFVFDNTFPSMANQNEMPGSLDVLFVDHPEWNVKISNVAAKGQGTSSMRYWKWNVRFTLDKKLSVVTAADGSTTTGGWAMTPSQAKATKITAKKNFASSMQSHKIGSVNSVNDLFRAMGYMNEAMKTEKYANARIAVSQLPFVAFEKSINDEGKEVYTFMGIYTMGPDKGDKNTFGFDTDLFPGLISIEGSDNSPLCTLFRVPWSSRMQYNEAEEAFQYNGANSWDFGAGDTANISKWIPAYNLAYTCSNRLKPFNGTLDELNAQVATYRNEPSEFWIAQPGDINQYNVYYYEASEGRFVPSDTGNGTINLKTQLDEYLPEDLSLFTSDQLNEKFIHARVQKFRKDAPAYWDIDDAILHRNWVEFHAGTDNRAKNTYPYCFGNKDSKWRWRYDDLDTIFDTDNQGQAKKEYHVEFHDKYTTGGSVWNGETSNFWNLIDLAFADEVVTGMRKMMLAMEKLSGLNSGTDFDKLYAYFQKYYFSQAQEYFPQNLYNADAKFGYENAKLAYIDGRYTNDTDPITQSLGDHYAAEQRWITKRILYMMSKYSFGLFSADGTDNITVRAAGNTIRYELTPAMDLYPGIANGTSIIRGTRTKAGEACEMLIELSGSGDQQNTIQGASYLQDIGDWHDKNVTGSMVIQGRMLRDIRLGSKTEPVSISISSLTVSNCISLQNLILSNIATLRGTLNLSACTHLKKVYAGGTSLTQLVLPKGGGLDLIEYSASNQYITLQNYPLITNQGILIDYCKENVTDFFVVNCPMTKPMKLLTDIMNSQAGQGENHQLKRIRAVGFDETYNTEGSGMLDKLATLANGSYSGLSSEGIAGEDRYPVLDGTLNVYANTYEDSIEALRNTFTKLVLNVVGEYYIRFMDSEIQKICIQRFSSDGVGLTKVDSEKVTSFIMNLFTGNTAIKDFSDFGYIFTNCQMLSHRAFENCVNLKKISLPPSLKIIGVSTFANTSISEIDLSHVTEISFGSFINCKFKNLIIPGNLGDISLAGAAFSNNSELLDVIFEEGVSAIGVNFFAACSNLQYVKLPSTITLIRDTVFHQCYSLQVLEIYAVTPPQLITNFGYGIPSSFKIYVPDNSVDSYKAAANWSTYANRIYPLSQKTE